MKKALIVTSVATMISQFNMGNIDILQKGGYKVCVACNFKKDNPCSKKEIEKIKNTLKARDVEIYQIDFSRAIKNIRCHFKAYSQLKKIAKRNFDIVHCQSPIGGVLTRLAFKKVRKKGTRLIYTAHGFHFYKGAPIKNWLLFYPVEKYLAKYTDTLITINNEDFERARKKFSKRCWDIQYVPGVGVDEKKFEKKISAKEKSELRKSLELKDDDRVLICVGRLDKNKNQGLLIKVIESLPNEYHLLLVGSDEINGKYQKMADRLGVSERVHFLGFRDDVDKILQVSDVMVSASKREGLPVNLIEAAILGLPIVATDCRGNRDVCEMNGSIVVRQGDWKEFAGSILKIQKNSANRDISLYTLDRVLINMSEIYFRKKRILHVLATNRFSGAENIACMIIKNLSNDCDMAYCSPDGPIANKLEDEKIDFILLKRLNIRNLRKAIRKFRPDFIHAHDARASVISSFCLAPNIGLIFHIHGNHLNMRKKTLKSVLFLFSSKKAKHIIWVSKDSLDDYCFRSKILSKSVVLKNVVDTEKVIKLAEEGVNCPELDIVYVGRLAYPKNPERLIEISKLLKKEKLEVKIGIVGDGEDLKVLESKIQEYGLEKNIYIFGFQKNPYPYIKKSKILILTSIYEGLPMVALEALSLDKTVITTNIETLFEMSKENKNIIVCNTNSEFVVAIQKVIKEYKYNDGCLDDKSEDKKRYLNKMMVFYTKTGETA